MHHKFSVDVVVWIWCGFVYILIPSVLIGSLVEVKSLMRRIFRQDTVPTTATTAHSYPSPMSVTDAPGATVKEDTGVDDV